MAITNLVLHVADVARSVDFYTGLLGATVTGERTSQRAVLDLVTATIEVRLLAGGAPCPWQEDDRFLGFRHLGFKVDAVDPLVARLRAAGVRFRIEPVDAVGEVRIAFFYDHDGTVLEIVEGHLMYHDVVDADAVAAERALPVPARPRFDHVGVTIRDLGATVETYRPLGFRHSGTLHFGGDPRGFRIDYLKGGDTVIEAFTFDVEVWPAPPRTDTYGFVAAQMDGDSGVLAGADVGIVGGRRVLAASDDFPVMVGR
jgi:catechol 2,3-dioxygenase-like lactoylglutathione lyase family enzyme